MGCVPLGGPRASYLYALGWFDRCIVEEDWTATRTCGSLGLRCARSPEWSNPRYGFEHDLCVTDLSTVLYLLGEGLRTLDSGFHMCFMIGLGFACVL